MLTRKNKSLKKKEKKIAKEQITPKKDSVRNTTQ